MPVHQLSSQLISSATIKLFVTMLLVNALFIVFPFLLWILWPTSATADMAGVRQQVAETARRKFLHDVDALLAADIRIPNDPDEDEPRHVFQQDVYLLGREVETVDNPCTATIARHRYRRNTRTLYVDFPMENLLDTHILHAKLNVHQSWLTTGTFLTAFFCRHSSDLGSLNMRDLTVAELTVSNGWASVDVGDWLRGTVYQPARVVLKLMHNGTLTFQQMTENPFLFVQIDSVERGKRQVGVCEQGMRADECCLEPIEYDFQALGYDQILPRKVTIHHCAGSCRPIMHTRDQHLNAYDSLVDFLKNPSRLVVGDKCCVPSDYKHLRIYKREASGRMVMKTLPRTDATNCHCKY